MTLPAALCALTALLVGLDCGRRFARLARLARTSRPLPGPGVRRLVRWLPAVAHTAMAAGLMVVGALLGTGEGGQPWMLVATTGLGGFALGALLPAAPLPPGRADPSRLPTA